MLRTPLGVDVPAASGGNYTANLIFDVAARAKFMRVDDIVEDRLGVQYTVLWWATFPGDFVSGGTAALGGTVTPTQSLTTDDGAVFTSGQLDVRPLISIDGSIGTVMDTGPTDGQNYDSEVTATWTSASQGNAATTGDHLIDSTGKAYIITSINVPGSSQWASGVTITELEKEGVNPQVGSAYLYSPTSNFAFYQGKVLSTIAEDARRNRDEFTTDVVISGIQNDITNVNTDLTSLATELGLVISSGDEFVTQNGLAASGFVTQSDVDANDYTTQADILASGFVTQTDVDANDYTTQADILASGFVTSHGLLSAEHTDTIAQAAVSGGLVAALDGAWSQLPPGADASIIFVEGGLPAYNSNFHLLPDGSVDIGGSTLISGDLSVLGNFDGTPDLNASGFVVGPASATDNAIGLYDGTTGKLIKDSEIFSSDGRTLQASGLIIEELITTSGLIVTDAAQLPPFNTLVVKATGTSSLGTVISGVWQADTIGSLYGGTAQTGYLTGDILYSSAQDTLNRLAIGASGEVLTVLGGIPSWQPAATGGGGGAGDISGPGSSTDNALTRWNGTAGDTIQDSLIIVNDSGTINLPAGVSQNITQASGNSSVSVLNTDWLVRVDTQGQAVVVTLPPSPVDGQVHNIKDGNGNAANNNITVSANTGQLIDPSTTSLTMNLDYQSVELMWVADPGVWHII